MNKEQILELAQEYLEILIADDDELNSPTDFAATQKQLIEFAEAIRRDTLYEVQHILKNVPNPEANRTAINRIEMELN